jgi:hypothetical protein
MRHRHQRHAASSAPISPPPYVKQALGLDRKKILLIHVEMGLAGWQPCHMLNGEKTEVPRNIREELVSVALKWDDDVCL